ncbi:MAG: DUF2182 domain-containing protein [Solirubrobacteraceae bacterium]
MHPDLTQDGDRSLTIAIVLLATAGAWVVTAVRMAGMDAGPATSPGGLGFYITTWTVMMVAMMLPSAMPAVLASRGRGWFVAGYLVVWAAAGLVAYGVLEAGRWVAGPTLAWNQDGRWAAAAVLLVAAGYELTAFKRRCLGSCRSAFVTRARSGGSVDAVRLGLKHGGWCLGCCLGLMVALFALGEMSLVWMALITVVIAVQKLVAHARTGVLVATVVLLALAIGVALAPSSVPALTIPGSQAAMHAMTGMR